jgi:hypothetical protein
MGCSSHSEKKKKRYHFIKKLSENETFIVGVCGFAWRVDELNEKFRFNFSLAR